MSHTLLIVFVLVSSVVLAIIVIVASSARVGARADVQSEQLYRAYRDGAISDARRHGAEPHTPSGPRQVAMAVPPPPEHDPPRRRSVG